MEVANIFIDGEDAYNNKRTCSSEHDRSSRYNNQRRRYHNEDSRILRNPVYAGYRRNDEEGGEHKSREYHKKDNSSGDKSRYFDPLAEDILNGPCHIHYAYLDGKRVSNHLIRDCRTFLKLQEAMELNQGAKPGSTAYDKRIVNQGCPIQSGQGYPQSKVYISVMIHLVPKSKKEQKNISRQVNLAISSPPATTEYLRWSDQTIRFSREDHPKKSTQDRECTNGVKGANQRIRYRTSIHGCWQWYKPNICKNFKGTEYITGMATAGKLLFSRDSTRKRKSSTREN
jgi:hypothetical protein